MYYYRVMGYDMHFPANQLGGPKKVWTIREYGLSQVWVKTETTVSYSHQNLSIGMLC